MTGRHRRCPTALRPVSGVSDADLDLSTPAGRDSCVARVRLTARFLCRRARRAAMRRAAVSAPRAATLPAAADAMGARAAPPRGAVAGGGCAHLMGSAAAHGQLALRPRCPNAVTSAAREWLRGRGRRRCSLRRPALARTGDYRSAGQACRGCVLRRAADRCSLATRQSDSAASGGYRASRRRADQREPRISRIATGTCPATVLACRARAATLAGR